MARMPLIRRLLGGAASTVSARLGMVKGATNQAARRLQGTTLGEQFRRASQTKQKVMHKFETMENKRAKQLMRMALVGPRISSVEGRTVRGLAKAYSRSNAFRWTVGIGTVGIAGGVGAIEGMSAAGMLAPTKSHQWTPANPHAYASKGRGMPADHLSTQGLTLALHKTRHR